MRAAGVILLSHPLRWPTFFAVLGLLRPSAVFQSVAKRRAANGA
jgi:hypothetical protein